MKNKKATINKDIELAVGEISANKNGKEDKIKNIKLVVGNTASSKKEKEKTLPILMTDDKVVMLKSGKNVTFLDDVYEVQGLIDGYEKEQTFYVLANDFEEVVERIKKANGGDTAGITCIKLYADFVKNVVEEWRDNGNVIWLIHTTESTFTRNAGTCLVYSEHKKYKKHLGSCIYRVCYHTDGLSEVLKDNRMQGIEFRANEQ